MFMGTSMLTERSARILGFVVDEYVNSGQPVGSNTVASKYGLSVSPATVRNEMVRLEEKGYIAQPHISAGLVPSDKGYRYYVETLMVEEEPPMVVRKTIRHQFHQAAQELEQWARLAATILARQVESLDVLATLDNRNLTKVIPPGAIPDQGVTIIIGSEHPEGTMRQYSLVVARYGGGTGVSSTLAVLGPTRMHYPRAVPMVRYTASLLSELLETYLI